MFNVGLILFTLGTLTNVVGTSQVISTDFKTNTFGVSVPFSFYSNDLGNCLGSFELQFYVTGTLEYDNNSLDWDLNIEYLNSSFSVNLYSSGDYTIYYANQDYTNRAVYLGNQLDSRTSPFTIKDSLMITNYDWYSSELDNITDALEIDLIYYGSGNKSYTFYQNDFIFEDLDFGSISDFVIYDGDVYEFNFVTSDTYTSIHSLIDKSSSNYNQAYDNGYNQGYNNGESVGYSNGYNQGYNDGFDADSTVFTIFNGILNVALVPINFFLGIFNFEILGINLKSLVSALLTVAVIIIVIRIVTGKKE